MSPLYYNTFINLNSQLLKRLFLILTTAITEKLANQEKLEELNNSKILKKCNLFWFNLSSAQSIAFKKRKYIIVVFNV